MFYSWPLHGWVRRGTPQWKEFFPCPHKDVSPMSGGQENLVSLPWLSGWGVPFMSLTCSSSIVDPWHRCSRSEMSSFSAWLWWTSSSSASSIILSPFLSSSSSFFSCRCSSLSRMLLNRLNSAWIRCLSGSIWVFKFMEEKKAASLWSWRFPL